MLLRTFILVIKTRVILKSGGPIYRDTRNGQSCFMVKVSLLFLIYKVAARGKRFTAGRNAGDIDYIIFNRRYCHQRSAVCAGCRSIAVAWVFAIVMARKNYLIHEVIKKCKNHDTRWERPGVQPGPAFRWTYFSIVLFAYFHRKKAIAYTDLLGPVYFYILFFFNHFHNIG